MKHVVAISGGKDSVAMALRLNEVEPRDYIYLITPTGDELPDMVAHWDNLECILGKKLFTPPAPTLRELIDEQNCLPNWRMRWCTRMIKIEPCIEWIRSQTEDVILYVGLRADEETRGGIYSDEVESRFPLRDWGWGVSDVWSYLGEMGITIPRRTDCARCPYQRLSEWYHLWRDFPDIYWDCIADEDRTGHTFRSETKDNHPGALRALGEKFESGWKPRGGIEQLDIFAQAVGCRVCSM